MCRQKVISCATVRRLDTRCFCAFKYRRSCSRSVWVWANNANDNSGFTSPKMWNLGIALHFPPVFCCGATRRKLTYTLWYQESLLAPPSGLGCQKQKKNQDGRLSVDMWVWLYFLKLVFINDKNPVARYGSMTVFTHFSHQVAP